MYLFKTELGISDFPHFYWLTRYRLSVHIPTVSNNYGKGNLSAIKQAENICSSEKKTFFDIRIAEMYPGFQIMGSSEPLLEKFGGPLQSFGGPANL